MTPGQQGSTDQPQQCWQHCCSTESVCEEGEQQWQQREWQKAAVLRVRWQQQYTKGASTPITEPGWWNHVPAKAPLPHPGQLLRVQPPLDADSYHSCHQCHSQVLLPVLLLPPHCCCCYNPCCCCHCCSHCSCRAQLLVVLLLETRSVLHVRTDCCCCSCRVLPVTPARAAAASPEGAITRSSCSVGDCHYTTRPCYCINTSGFTW